MVQVEQLTALLPTEERQEMESLSAPAPKLENSRLEGPQEDICPKERITNEANIRRSRASPPPRLQRSSSLGSLKQSRKGNGCSPRRRDIGLRLPSFRGLGISSLEPKYLTRGGHTEAQQPRLEALSRTPRPSLRPRPSSIYHHASGQNLGSTPLLTPPEDTNSIKWNNAVLHPSSSSNSQCRDCGTHYNRTNVVASLSMDDNTSGSSSSLPAQQERPDHRGNISVPRSPHQDNSSGDNQGWLDQAIEKTGVYYLNPFSLSKCARLTNAVSSIGRLPTQTSTVNVVAHVLPLPAEDSSPHHAVFAATIQAIQERHGPGRQPYITITHAVPHKFDLNSLPTSPPATPNLAQEGGDYFNHYTFAHAAVVPAYHAPIRGLSTFTNSSPNPIVPPRSVQVALLERYIPPSSIQEYNDLFSSHGRSALLDRLSELSVDGGTLLFICPTKTGATTFSESYLSPILTPNLLQIVNLNRLVWNLAEDIGRIAAIPIMNEFDIMKTKINNLCKSMSESRSAYAGSRFELIYSSTGSVPLDQATWREWYIEQEKGRIREVLKSYWKQGRRLPGDTEVTDATIARAIIDGLRKGVKDAKLASGQGVEVGVFVIKRSPAST